MKLSETLNYHLCLDLCYAVINYTTQFAYFLTKKLSTKTYVLLLYLQHNTSTYLKVLFSGMRKLCSCILF